MANVSILTIGDCSRDRILEVSENDAGLLCNLKSHKCEITFNYGEKIPIQTVHRGFGGSALNCAIGFSKIGHNLNIATFVGNDEEGKKIILFLKDNHIGLNQIRVDGLTNESSIICFGGERTVFSYHAKRDYSNLTLSDANWIYFCSTGRGSDVLNNKIVEFANQGSKIVFNPGSWQLNNFKSFLKIVERSEVLILNRQEADLVIGLEGRVREQLAKMEEMGARIAVITDGKNGAYFGTGGNFMHLNPVASKAVDTTGAGDSFSSGFVGALALGRSLEESAKWGMVDSGSVVEKFGANAGLLDSNTIVERLNTIKTFKFTLI